MKHVSAKIDEGLYAKVKDRAKTEGLTINEVITRLLAEWVRTWETDYTLYTVQPGDTLARIAYRVYGDSSKYTLIAEYNGLQSPYPLEPGDVLRIPPISKPTGPTETGEVESAVPVPEELEITFVPSPHFNKRPPGTRIWAIVVHATANSTLTGVLSWFQNPTSYLSAHYVIGKDGKIVQMVRDEDRAWHAGASRWKGIDNVNNFSIGIELVNLNDGQDPYPEAQYQALVALCRRLVARYGIQLEDIVAHRDICVPPGNKTDPLGLDMVRLREDVFPGLSGQV